MGIAVFWAHPKFTKQLVKTKKLTALLSKDSKEFQEYSSNATKKRWGYNLLGLLTSITFLDKVNFPKIKTITMYGKDIMKNNAASFQSIPNLRYFLLTVISAMNLRICLNFRKIPLYPFS